MSEEAPPVPISLVAHTVFCHRRAWLEAAGEQVASYNIEDGQRSHARVDGGGRAGVRSFSVHLRHDELNLTGRADVVTSSPGHLELIEFKATPGKRTPEVSEANRVQLALQRMCLEAAGATVTGQSVYFIDHRSTVAVEFTEQGLAQAREFARLTRRIVEAETPPDPLIDDPRCTFCSHISVCLPDERQRGPVKRPHASDPDGEVLHLATPGSRASIRGDRIQVSRRGEELASIPTDRVAGLIIHGNVDVSSALLRELLWRGISIIWCSGRGRVVGFARSAKSPNGQVRARQHRGDSGVDSDTVKEMLRPKVGNQATQLRRNGRGVAPDVVAQLRSIDRSMAHARNTRELLAYEGRAAAIYFGCFTDMLNPQGLSEFGGSWAGRHGRGAADPLNVGLNFLYGLLCADAIRALLSCGLDPHLGLVHSARRNKPALALDLMEQFRPIIGDSVLFAAINNGEISRRSFARPEAGGGLTEEGRRALTSSYERRLRQSIKHPVYGYTVTWRRAMEVQARMLLASYETAQSPYIGIRTR